MSRQQGYYLIHIQRNQDRRLREPGPIKYLKYLPSFWTWVILQIRNFLTEVLRRKDPERSWSIRKMISTVPPQSDLQPFTHVTIYLEGNTEIFQRMLDGFWVNLMFENVKYMINIIVPQVGSQCVHWVPRITQWLCFWYLALNI